MKLSILIPVYNEAFTVQDVMAKVQAVRLPDGIEKEIIAVDDCSKDDTLNSLKQLAEQYGNLQVFHHELNQGKGAAIRTAIEKSTGDIVVIQDADLEYDPEDYNTLLKPILKGVADVVYGSRFLPSTYRRVLYFWHSMGNRFLTMLSNMFTDLNLTDMETCYKMVRGDILRSIPIRSDRFGMEPELTAKLAKRGCRIYEVPISYHGRTYAEGKKITWWDGVKALFVIIYYRLVDDLYTDQYGHGILHSLSRTHRFNSWMAETIRPWVGDEVLEIGAGMGNLTRQFLPRKSYVASDLDPLHLHYLENLYEGNSRVNVARIDIEKAEEIEPHARKFDTVICLNVIEHVEDDVSAMKNILTALKPGGRACILTPNNPDLFGTLDEVLEHRRRYTEKDLRDKLESAGFEVEKVFTLNSAAVPAWWLNGKIMKRKYLGKLQLKIFDYLVWLLRVIDPILPWKGLSVVAIAKKPEA
ncbi:MAG: glycosyltransferase [Verrucomicrobia bacterium]|nr:glycosyltransferase [Verrucomicrobiota bacterium]